VASHWSAGSTPNTGWSERGAHHGITDRQMFIPSTTRPSCQPTHLSARVPLTTRERDGRSSVATIVPQLLRQGLGLGICPPMGNTTCHSSHGTSTAGKMSRARTLETPVYLIGLRGSSCARYPTHYLALALLGTCTYSRPMVSGLLAKRWIQTRWVKEKVK
jgi:hypothetical protein